MRSRFTIARRRLPRALVVGLCSVMLPALAGAAPSAVTKAHADARAYAKAHGFEAKMVTAGPQGRRVKRLFVPVTEETVKEFRQRFGSDKGHILLQWSTAFGSEVFVSRGADDWLLWANKQSGYSNTQGFGVGSRLMVPAMSASQLSHWSKWVASTDGHAMANKVAHGNCMTWIPNAEVSKGVKLFDYLGNVTRSNNGPNMKAKLLHAANEKLAVVGVCVANASDFKAMKTAELLGDKPLAGIEDSIR